MINKLFNIIKHNKLFVIANVVFLTIYSLICFVNHYNFRTYALDLGVYTRALYDYAHFRMNYCEVFILARENMLCAHFDLLLMLFSPLYWLFGNITLLVVQLVAIHIGAYGVYRLSQISGLNKKTSTLVSLVFLSSFGIFAAVAYDYHSNAVATCLVPWFILFLKEEKFLKASIAFVLILVAKENMALWLFFVCIGFWFLYKGKNHRKAIILFAIISLCFFATVVFIIMPALSLTPSYDHFEFHVLGNCYKEAFLYIIKHPLKAFLLLFQNHLPDAALNNIKAETWVFWFISGGFLFFYRPVFLWMLIPVMLQKMYHDDPTKWSVAQQYNIEFAPLVAFCLIEIIKTRRQKPQIWLSFIIWGLCLGVTIRLCDNTISFVDKTRIRFYQADHYKSDFNKADVRILFDKIPGNATVSAESIFVPHLIDRKMVYQYPIVKEAQYILLSKDTHSYPLSKKEMLNAIDSLCSSTKWRHISLNNNLYLFEINEKN